MNDSMSGEQDRFTPADKLVKAGLMVLLFAVPLVFTPPNFPWRSHEVATPPKIALAQTILLPLSLAWLAGMNARGKFAFHLTAIFWALAAYLGTQALSLVKAPNVGYGLFELRVFIFWFIAYLLVTHHATERDIVRMFSAIALSGALASVYGILQSRGIDFVDWGVKRAALDTMSTLDKTLYDRVTEILGQGPASFGHNNFAAHFLITAIPVACALMFIANAPIARIGSGIALLIMLRHLDITGCRGAVIGLGIGAAVCITLGLRRAVALSRSGRLTHLTLRQTLWVRRAFFVSIIAAVIAVGSLWGSKGIRMVDRFGKGVDSPFVSRINAWRSSFEAFRDSPVTGVGKGNFEVVTPAYWTEYEREVFARDLTVSPEVHNEYIEIALETGVLGFGAFVWLLVCVASQSSSLWAKELTRKHRAIVLAAVCALVAVCVDSLFNFDLQTPAAALNFFVLIGVLDAVGLAYEPRITVISLPNRGWLSWKTTIWVLIAVYAAAGPFSIARPFLTQVRIAQGAAAMSRGDHKEAVRQFESAARLSPWDWSASYRLGNAYMATKQYDKAIELYKACLRIAPNYALAWSNLGLTHFYLNKFDTAIEAAQHALSVAPELPMGHNVLGLCYAKQEKWAEALQELKLAVSLPRPGRGEVYKNMAICYYKLGQRDEALKQFELAIEENPAGAAELYVEKGTILFELKQYDKALTSLQEGVRLFVERKVQAKSNPYMLKAYYWGARISLEQLDDPYGCAAIVVELSRTVPRDAGVRALTDKLGTYLSQHRSSRKGASATWYYLGSAYLLQGRYDEAEKTYKALVESGEKNVKILQITYRDYALAVFKKGEPDRALQIIEQAKRIAPNYQPLNELKTAIITGKMAAQQTKQR